MARLTPRPHLLCVPHFLPDVAMRVHRQRPAGPNQDILLFLAGQDEIGTAAHAARGLAAELKETEPVSLLPSCC